MSENHLEIAHWTEPQPDQGWCCSSCRDGCLLPCEYCRRLPGVGCGTNKVGQFACVSRQEAYHGLTELQRMVLRAVHRV